MVDFGVFTSCYCFSSYMTTIFVSFMTIRVSLTLRAGVVILLGKLWKPILFLCYWLLLLSYLYWQSFIHIIHSLLVSSIKGGDCQFIGYRVKKPKSNLLYILLFAVVYTLLISSFYFITHLYMCVFICWFECFYTKNSELN